MKEAKLTKGEEMLFFNVIYVNKHTKGHIIESRLTCWKLKGLGFILY